jgi:FixJ family two-component response regulator
VLFRSWWRERWRNELVAQTRIVVAESADALLDLLQTMTTEERAQIDLLVTDLIMPGTMGEELIRKLDARGYVLPVVIITAYGSTELQSTSGLNWQSR